MISVIVCSVDKIFYQALFKNIEETIGAPFEVIRIDNSNNSFSICGAYNNGASKAKFPYLCFVHEDVLFKTNNWGLNIINHFEADAEAGMLGVAGSVYKAKMTSGWGQSEEGWLEPKRMNIFQHYKQADRPGKHIFLNPFNEVRSSVVTIDGVLMITKKEIWRTNKFDEKLLKGFHGYDIDFSLQILQSKKIVVVYDILIDHFSGGNFDSKYLDEVLKVHKKWQKYLPATIQQCEPAEVVYDNGWKRLRKNMVLLIDEGYNFTSLVKRYNAFFAQLDNAPGFRARYKKYFIELFRFMTLYYKRRSASV